MGKLLLKVKRHARLLVQIGFMVLTNGNFKGFAEGRIYTGNTKHICVPGLNCYSCPGALGACPIGSLQAVEGSRFRVSFYVVGLLVVFGAVLGRFVCGWFCPFGLVQDLFHKIPSSRKIKKLPGDRVLRYGKYVILAVLVVLLPSIIRDAFGIADPWFCKYLCPSGTLMGGIPLVLANPSLQDAVGGLFWWKMGLLVFLLVLSILVWRPFCRYLCPLGVIYGFFNPIAVVHYDIDREKCTGCGACQRACKLDLCTYQTPNSRECVRCGDCKRTCPHQAIRICFFK
ncbi:MAG: 4Fe-4S binding protein [Clostridia bacterium]